LKIGIVAHIARIQHAEALADDVGADYISVDDGTLGCEGNHRKVWEHLAAQDSEWTVVIEDDAIPVDDFRHQLEQILAVSPTPIVSLYLGRSRPWAGWQTLISLAVEKANHAGAHWIISHSVLHAVALAIKTELVPSMLTWIETHPVDDSITRWAKNYQLRVGYPWPSIIDHRDGPTLIDHPDGDPRAAGRVAWWCDTRSHWNNTSVTM
jgi:hypothetical protein